MIEEMLRRAVAAWLEEDPDPLTREELYGLLESAHPQDHAELADRFSGLLSFGTAGLRGALGGGPNRMNRAVVIRATAGLCAHLRETHRDPLLVVGYDARHRSADFARDVVAVAVGAGLRAVLIDRPLPTPVLAFAVRRLGAAAGVMVTASHNPPQDSGYKVFLENGAQLAPPVDAQVAAQIDAVERLADVPLAEAGWAVVDREPDDPQGVWLPYLDRAVSVLDPGSPRDTAVVHTSLHGVGHETVRRAFALAGFPEPAAVQRQAAPDPDFPTVSFPNPEEPGALDLAFATAREERPDLVIANDPDADRCAVAVPDETSESGWRMLRGDEVGALLAVHLARRGARGTFVTTIVSSSLLSRIAAEAGLPFRQTLTGFKWMSQVEGLRYAYEEALGYCTDPEGVRDKDGVTAALLIAELAAVLKRDGRTLGDLLDELALRHGVHATDQLSVRVSELSLIADAMRGLRAQPPAVLGGLRVESAEDLLEPGGELPATDALRYRLAGERDGRAVSARIVVRPSGTEPKLKCYLEAVVAEPDDLLKARSVAAGALAAIRADLGGALGLG